MFWNAPVNPVFQKCNAKPITLYLVVFLIFWLYVCLICSGTLLSVFHSATVSLLHIPHILMMDSLPHLGNIFCWEIWYSCSSKMYKKIACGIISPSDLFNQTVEEESRFYRGGTLSRYQSIAISFLWRHRTTWATLEQPSFSKKPQSMRYCWSVWCWLPLVFQLKVTDSWHVGRHLGSIYSTGPITHSKHWKQGWRSSQSLQ